MPGYLILGCGYTGQRVARALVDAGNHVVCTSRHAGVTLDTSNRESLAELIPHLSEGMTVLNSIPVTDATPQLLDVLRPFHPSRLVYLSTTGVYGAAEAVDEHAEPHPDTERDAMRVETENLIASGPWSSLILRPAAIYGPGRGVHTSARAGVFRAPPGGNRVISRIHVDDLAAHVLAGLQSDLTGAFPVADEEPCPSQTVAAFAFELLGLPFVTAEREPAARDERKAGRRVDGSAYRRTLGLHLRYPSYREGVPACLDAEGPSPR